MFADDVSVTLARSSITNVAQGDVEGAQGAFLSEIEQAINNFFNPIAEWLSEIVFGEISVFGVSFPWIVAWLLLAGVIFTGYFGFVQFRNLKLATDVVRGKYTKEDEPGEISHFQALSSAVSGTVGLGNIAGVGLAVTIGGAGATFWMILAGLLGMCTKFVECTVGVRYRDVHPDGTVSGGPMQYLRKGIAERIPGNAGKIIGRVLAVLAAIGILLFGIAGGNMFQANQSVAQLRGTTGGEDSFLASDGAALVVGIVLALIVGLVVFGGIKAIGKVTSKLVPSMALVYVAACATVILVNLTHVPDAIGSIISGAFTAEGVVGGVVGGLIVGIQRAVFSNEAGLGSAPIAHSAVRTKHPATEGLVALLEPFIDTVIVCTMTALTIVIADTQFWNETQAAYFADQDTEFDGVTITSNAFETVLPWFPYVLTVAVLLFAISTMITWAYYGEKAWTYLFGRSKTSQNTYRFVYCAFIVIGSVLAFTKVVDFTNAVMFLLALFNIIGLYLLASVVKRELTSYRNKIRSGEVTKLEHTR